MSNFLPERTVERLYAAFARGFSERQIARALRLSGNTVRGYRRLWLAAGNVPPRCGCGKVSNHNGWCSPRFRASPLRQRALRALHVRQRKHSIESVKCAL